MDSIISKCFLEFKDSVDKCQLKRWEDIYDEQLDLKWSLNIAKDSKNLLKYHSRDREVVWNVGNLKSKEQPQNTQNLWWQIEVNLTTCELFSVFKKFLNSDVISMIL